jgi:hypothetical protein
LLLLWFLLYVSLYLLWIILVLYNYFILTLIFFYVKNVHYYTILFKIFIGLISLDLPRMSKLHEITFNRIGITEEASIRFSGISDLIDFANIWVSIKNMVHLVISKINLIHHVAAILTLAHFFQNVYYAICTFCVYCLVHCLIGILEKQSFIWAVTCSQ